MHFLKYEFLKLKSIVLAGQIVAIVTYDVASFLKLRLKHQLIKVGNNGPSQSMSWKVVETVLSRFKCTKVFVLTIKKK